MRRRSILMILSGLLGLIFYFSRMAVVYSEEQPIEKVSRNSYFGYGYGIPEYRHQMAKLNTSVVKFSGHLFFWGKVERQPPKDGRHFYNWRLTDDIVSQFQDVNEVLHVVLKSRNNWAGRANTVDYPPLPEYLDDYGDFVYAIVERYDGDGIDDMPDLRNPVKFWNVSEEVQNYSRWGGTPQDYEEILKLVYKKVKAADPSATVLLAGINTGEAITSSGELKEVPEARLVRKDWEEYLKFTKRNLSLCQYYDVVNLHFNHGWEGIPDTIKFVRGVLEEAGCPDKEIWAADMINSPIIEHTLEGKQRDTLITKLQNEDPETMTWFREEQCRLTMKKVVTSLAYGIKKINLEPVADPPSEASNTSTSHGGILNDDGSPRPVFHSYKLLIDKLDGFSSVKKLETILDVWAYEFIMNGKKIYVLWGKGVIPSEISGQVRVFDMVGHESIADTSKISLSDNPIFIEY